MVVLVNFKAIKLGWYKDPQWVEMGLFIVFSVLKRKHKRDVRNEQIRNQHFPSKASKFEVDYYVIN